MVFFDFNDILSKSKVKVLMCYIALGLLLTFLFSGKTSITLEAIAVSPDEQYVACFVRGDGYKIRCFYANGNLAFDFKVLSDISGGGHCALWFEEDVLCALFYRTDKIVHFAMDGTMLNIAKDTTEKSPPKFLSFSQMGHEYVFEGKEITVIYNKGHFLGYWFGREERYLSITPKGENINVVYAWTAK